MLIIQADTVMRQGYVRAGGWSGEETAVRTEALIILKNVDLKATGVR